MINKLEITGVHLKTDPKLQAYINKKIGKLDHYIPRGARESAHAEVFVKEIKRKAQKQYQCEVVMHLPHEVFTITEMTINTFAAVDIVESKLKIQLKKYKDLHGNPKLHRRLIRRFRR